jgi:hypothetical protein
MEVRSIPKKSHILIAVAILIILVREAISLLKRIS